FRRSLLSVLSTRILPPPRSTLFPYTTLFRSQFEQHLRAVLDLPLGCPEMTAEVAVMANVLGSQLPDPSSAYPEVMRTYPEAKVQDRKSTRLNSSHVSISYAVFCLKKKKRIRT